MYPREKPKNAFMRALQKHAEIWTQTETILKWVSISPKFRTLADKLQSSIRAFWFRGPRFLWSHSTIGFIGICVVSFRSSNCSLTYVARLICGELSRVVKTELVILRVGLTGFGKALTLKLNTFALGQYGNTWFWIWFTKAPKVGKPFRQTIVCSLIPTQTDNALHVSICLASFGSIAPSCWSFVLSVRPTWIYVISRSSILTNCGMTFRSTVWSRLFLFMPFLL